jgi:hypothetical protein
MAYDSLSTNGINIIFSSSSRGKNGAIASKGGENSDPSARFIADGFGSKAWSESTNTSRMA